ncbi:transglutaminase domain-containing protein [Viridibacillus sp. NPDC093762]|uniref:transglutaminase domain-containing protein n=1 Tax=Viridibacillus sp. NPDC093762 TaxID=3390720 RepID=UPI003CFF97A2
MRKVNWYLSIFSLILILALTSSSDRVLEVSAAKDAVTVSSVKGLKTAVSRAMHNYDGKLTISYKGNITQKMDQINGVVEQLLAADDYLSGSFKESNIHYQYNSSSAIINYTFSYHTSKSQEQYVDAQVKRFIKEEISEKMSDFDKVKAINNYIVLNTKYGSDTHASAHSAYAVFKEGKAVCQGYTLAAYKLYQAAGIDVRYVVGYVDQVAHSWNLVKVDGKWYHIDSTFNDPTPDRAGKVSSKYFLLSDSALAEDHRWVTEDYQKASDTTYNFIRDTEDFVKSGDKVYYTKSDGSRGIYIRDTKTGNENKITNTNAKYLVKAEDWLYFSNKDQKGYLTKINKDGSKQMKINEQESSNLKVLDQILYYTANGKEQTLNLNEIVEEDQKKDSGNLFSYIEQFFFQLFPGKLHE